MADVRLVWAAALGGPFLAAVVEVAVVNLFGFHPEKSDTACEKTIKTQSFALQAPDRGYGKALSLRPGGSPAGRHISAFDQCFSAAHPHGRTGDASGDGSTSSLLRSPSVVVGRGGFRWFVRKFHYRRPVKYEYQFAGYDYDQRRGFEHP